MSGPGDHSENFSGTGSGIQQTILFAMHSLLYIIIYSRVLVAQYIIKPFSNYFKNFKSNFKVSSSYRIYNIVEKNNNYVTLGTLH